MWRFSKTNTRCVEWSTMYNSKASPDFSKTLKEEFVEQLDLLIDAYNAAVGDLSPVQQPLGETSLLGGLSRALALASWNASAQGSCR